MLTAGLLARRVITFCPPSRMQEILRPVASGQTARRLQLRGQPRLDPADTPNRPRSLLIPPPNERVGTVSKTVVGRRGGSVKGARRRRGLNRLYSCLYRREAPPRRAGTGHPEMAITATASIAPQLNTLNRNGTGQTGSPADSSAPVAAENSSAVAATTVLGSSSQQSAAVSQAQSALRSAENVVARREAELSDAQSAVSAASDRADQRRRALSEAEGAERVALAEDLQRGSLVNISV